MSSPLCKVEGGGPGGVYDNILSRHRSDVCSRSIPTDYPAVRFLLNSDVFLTTRTICDRYPDTPIPWYVC